MDLIFERLSDKAFAPKRAHSRDSGFDVFTPIDVVIRPNDNVLIPLDLKFAIPEGYDLSVYNKSGISTKYGVIKGAELIDVDYRGNVGINLLNFTKKTVTFLRGDKIAQIVMRPVALPNLVEGEVHELTDRGTRGFGSTGK